MPRRMSNAREATPLRISRRPITRVALKLTVQRKNRERGKKKKEKGGKAVPPRMSKRKRQRDARETQRTGKRETILNSYLVPCK